MNMMSIGFRFHITSATIPIIPDELLTVDIAVAPRTGLFTFTTAVALSLMCNHVIFGYHRNCVAIERVDDGRRGSHAASISSNNLSSRLLEEGEAISELEDTPQPRYCIEFPENSWFDVGTKEAHESGVPTAIALATARVSLANQSFVGTLPSMFLTNDSTGRFNWFFQTVIILLAMLIFCLIIAAGIEDSFEFVFVGLAGDLIRIVDPPQSERRTSLLLIAQKLGEKTSDGNEFGVLYLQSLYLLFSFVFPLVLLGLTMMLLFFPFVLREAKVFFYTVELVSAWAALDVFVVALISSVLQINQFSHFLEGPLCDPIKDVLRVSECFGVETKLLKGTWLIVAASCFLWCFVQFAQRISERAIASREEEVLEAAAE